MRVAGCLLDRLRKSPDFPQVRAQAGHRHPNLQNTSHPEAILTIPPMTDVGMLFIIPLIRTVAIKQRAVRQLRPVMPNRQIVTASGMRRRSAGDGDAAFFGDDIFLLQRVALPFSGVMRLLGVIAFWAVYRLFGAGDDDRQGFFLIDPRLGVQAEQRPRDFFDRFGRPADDAFVNVEGACAGFIQQRVGDATENLPYKTKGLRISEARLILTL